MNGYTQEATIDQTELLVFIQQIVMITQNHLKIHLQIFKNQLSPPNPSHGVKSNKHTMYITKKP